MNSIDFNINSKKLVSTGAFVLLQDSITNKNWNKRFLGTTSMNAKMNRYHVTQGMKDI